VRGADLIVTNNREEYREFNAALIEAIEETIREVFSPIVLEALYKALLERYDVTRDELPYRLETANKILTDVFGLKGAETLGRAIAGRLFAKLGLRFEESKGLNILDYVEIAKRKLTQATRSDLPNGLCTPTSVAKLNGYKVD